MTENINSRYQLNQQIGQGGMGVVYSAIDRLTGETVALKQVHLSSNLQISDSLKSGTTADDLRLALAHEFQILAGLRHPHIISVLDYGFDKQRQPFFTMSYLPESQNILDAAQDAPFERKIELLQQLLQALAYLHQRGVLHRDLKSENVLVADGVVRVLDFGLSASDQTGGGSLGTPLYMAPELFEGKSYSPQADLYAVGVIMYQLLTDKHPFAPFDHAFLDRVLDDEPSWSCVDEQFRPLLIQLLAKDPANRPATANATLVTLAESLGQPLPKESSAIRESYLQAAKFVGREAELAQLTAVLEKTESVVWLVGGESGVGKTRLLEEVRSHALVVGWQVLAGQAVPEGGLPYQLWQDIVPHLALTSDLSDLEAGILRQITPALDNLLGRNIPEPPALQGIAVQQRLILTLVSILQRQPQPTLLLLEDLQWTRESLAPLQQMLKVREQMSKVLVIATYRDDEQPNLPEKLIGSHLLQLNRLDVTQVAKLSQSMLGEKSSTPEIVSLLTQETEGNTFFIVEVMRALAEEAGRLGEIASLRLPNKILTQGMQQLLWQRVQQIPEDKLSLLQLTAAAGRHLDVPLLQHLLKMEDLTDWLQQLSDAAFIIIREDRWSFAHDKLRELVLSEMSAEERPSTHRLVAEAIEQIYPENTHYYPYLLEHWHLAVNIDKELHYLLPVVAELIEMQANFNEAHKLLIRGLQAIGENDLRYATLLDLLGQACMHQGKFADASQHTLRSLALAQQLNDQQGIAFALQTAGRLSLRQSDFIAAKQNLEQSLAVWRQLGSQHGMAVCLNNLGRAAWLQGQLAQAKEHYKQAMHLFQPIGNQTGIADCLNELGLLADAQGDFNSAFAHHQLSLTIRQKIGDKLGIAKSLGNLGILSRNRGDFAQAYEYLQNCLDTFQTIGDRMNVAIAYYNLGMAAHQQRNYDEAETLYKESLIITHALGEKYGIAYAKVKLGFTYLECRPDRVRVTLQDALSLAHEIQARTIILETLLGFAHHFSLQCEFAQAGQITGFLQQQSAIPLEMRQLLDAFTSELEITMGKDLFRESIAQGKPHHIEQIIAELLEGRVAVPLESNYAT